MRKFTLVFILLVFVLVGCDTLKEKDPTSKSEQTPLFNESSDYTKQLEQLEKISIHEEYHYYPVKELSIFFTHAIDLIQIQEVELLSEESSVAVITGSENISVKDKNLLILKNTPLLSHFDTVVIKEGRTQKKIKIFVGDYYFSGHAYQDQLVTGKEMFVRKNHYKQSNGKITYKISFNNIPESDIQFTVPDSLSRIATTEQKLISKDSSLITYQFEVFIPKSYFEKQKISGFNFSLHADQVNSNSRKTIFEAFIPLTAADYLAEG